MAFIKSIQYFSTNLVDPNLTKDITISAVNTTYTVVQLSIVPSDTINNNANYNLCTGALTSSTNLRLTRFNTGADTADYNITVIEFYPNVIKSLNAYQVNATPSSQAASATVAITAVNLSKALWFSAGLLGTSNSSPPVINNNPGWVFNSTVQMTFSFKAVSGSDAVTGRVYVVEFV